MKHKYTALAIFALLAAIIVPTVDAVNSGSGSVKFGYTFLDDEGSRAVNQETFNTYEGLGLSLKQWRYDWDSGMRFKADLTNITLNNRNLRMSIGKPGRFGVAVTNNQYRRAYDSSGNDFTRRRATNVQANYQPNRYIKINAGYGLTEKHGADFFVLPALSDTVSRSADWSQKMYTAGAQIGDRHGFFKVDYRRFDFTDNTPAALNRQADQINLQASSTVPRLRWAYVSGGLNYRKDKFDHTATELTTSQYWGGTNLYVLPTLVIDYRLIYAITKRNIPAQTVDNVQNTVTLGKAWSHWGGARVGYENRVSDDFVNRTKSDGFLANAWARPIADLYVSGGLATRKADVTDGVTLMGDENRTSHSLMARYTKSNWGDVSARWEGRVRRNDDLNSRVSYNALSPELNLTRPNLGRLTVTYSYYVGKFENRSDTTSYEFADHVVTGHIYPVTVRNVTVDFGGTYYRSKRNQDIEKFNVDFGAAYSFPKGYRFEVRYNAYNFDDFLVMDKFYTANIVEISLIKDVQF